MMSKTAKWRLWGPGLLALAMAACTATTGLFNPSFVNTVEGDVFPRTPGPNADFVLVRVVNETPDVIRFFVTSEKRQLVRDAEGNIERDAANNPITEDVLQKTELTTYPDGKGKDIGVLFDCSVAAVLRVGLGENLLPSDAAVFVTAPADFNFGDPLGAQQGFGVLAEGLNPLQLFAGNFNCGDTVIFRAISTTSLAGGVKVEAFVLPGSEQPSQFDGPNTFANYEAFLESQIREDESP